MSWAIELTGIDEAREQLDEVLSRIDDPAPVLPQVAQILIDRARQVITSGGRGAPRHWPPLSARTLAIRDEYGVGRAPLQRRGDLLNSIQVLGIDGRQVVVGSRHSAAAIVHDGGETRGPLGERVRVPARPFLTTISADLDEMETLFLDYVLAGEVS